MVKELRWWWQLCSVERECMPKERKKMVDMEIRERDHFFLILKLPPCEESSSPLFLAHKSYLYVHLDSNLNCFGSSRFFINFKKFVFITFLVESLRYLLLSLVIYS